MYTVYSAHLTVHDYENNSLRVILRDSEGMVRPQDPREIMSFFGIAHEKFSGGDPQLEAATALTA